MTDTSSYVGQCEVKSPLIAQVAVGWSRLWDACLSLGGKHITGLRAAEQLMGHHGKGQHPCPLEGPQLPSIISSEAHCGPP